MANFSINRGVTGAYIGRWATVIIHGKLVHQYIINTKPVRNENRIALIFNFVVGGGIVAQFYSVILEFIECNSSVNHLLLATLSVLITGIMPLCTFIPSFG